MTAKILAAIVALPFVAATGCATVEPPATASAVKAAEASQDKSFRTGSRLPTMTNYYGPELLKSVEAERDREAMDKMVNPIRPLVAP